MITDKSSIKALTLLVVSQMNHDVNPDILMSAMLEADCAALSDLVDVIEKKVEASIGKKHDEKKSVRGKKMQCFG